MNLRIIFGLMWLILDGIYAECDDSQCLQVCQLAKLDGRCIADKCECSFGQTCSTMLNTCDAACSILNMEGECDANDQCECSTTPEWCNAEECQESCEDDPRAIECISITAVGCIKYGPAKFCNCICYQWGLNDRRFKHWSTLRRVATPKSKYISVTRI